MAPSLKFAKQFIAPALEYARALPAVQYMARHAPKVRQLGVDCSIFLTGALFMTSTNYVKRSGKKNNNEWRTYTANFWNAGHFTNISIGAAFVGLKYSSKAVFNWSSASRVAAGLRLFSWKVTKLKPIGIFLLFAGTIPSTIAAFTDKVQVKPGSGTPTDAITPILYGQSGLLTAPPSQLSNDSLNGKVNVRTTIPAAIVAQQPIAAPEIVVRRAKIAEASYAPAPATYQGAHIEPVPAPVDSLAALRAAPRAATYDAPQFESVKSLVEVPNSQLPAKGLVNATVQVGISGAQELVLQPNAQADHVWHAETPAGQAIPEAPPIVQLSVASNTQGCAFVAEVAHKALTGRATFVNSVERDKPKKLVPAAIPIAEASIATNLAQEAAPVVADIPPSPAANPLPAIAAASTQPQPPVFVASRIRPFEVLKSVAFFVGTSIVFLGLRKKLNPSTFTSYEGAALKGYNKFFSALGASNFTTKGAVYASSVMLTAQSFQMADALKSNDENIKTATWYGGAATLAMRFIK